MNTYTAGHQALPMVMADASGNFVVAWTSTGQDGSGDGVYARRFDSVGAALGPELHVPATTLGDQTLTRLDVRADGSFTIQWEDSTEQGAPLGYFSQDFSTTGQNIEGPRQLGN